MRNQRMTTPIRKILIANRGEIAMRVVRSCRQLGLASVAVYSDADRGMPWTRAADEAVYIGPSEASASYLNIDRLIAACRETGADAVHPGYGFLSENASFAERLAAEGLRFIGPTPAAMRAMGDKIAARRLMESRGVPVVPGYDGDDQSLARLRTEAERIGTPLLIKASAGGGGRGMRLVQDLADFSSALESAQREAQNAFGDSRVFLERFVAAPRHIEIQVFGDMHGNIVHLFERECSIQRRHQKIIEESPSPALTPAVREAMARAAVQAAAAVNYVGAGTIEFIYSDADAGFYFLEMNTRLQVEHPVTEMVVGLDLVAEQIRVAEGRPLSFRQEDVRQTGHALEVRLYAEDPAKNFLPSTGRVVLFEVPEIPGVRVDAGVETGSEISIYYDPMAAKIIAHSVDRESAIDLLRRALAHTVFFGPENNLAFLDAVLADGTFRAGRFTTRFIEERLANWKGAELLPAEIQRAKSAVALLHFHNARARGAERTRRQDSAFDGFRLWGV